ncbi:MAG: phosphatidylglycerol lysyltransferase domain-containing protein [Candidatus Omnitrophota bacterium]
MKSVPVFPRKRPVELSDKLFFDRYVKKFPPEISEITFTNIFAWRHAYQFELSILDDFLLVISSTPQGLEIFEPIGVFGHKRDVVESCFYRVQAGLPMKFVRLTEATIESFRDEAVFKVAEDRDNDDYLYARRDLVELPGAKYDGKRNLIRRFQESQPFVYKKLSKNDIVQCLYFQENWCAVKNCCHTKGFLNEKQACVEMLENFEDLNIFGAMIEIGSKVEAVTLAQELNPETIVIHMEKANDSFMGIYQAINHLFALSLPSEYRFINRQQDLGVEGLRIAKQSYHPCRMVKKYTLSQRPSESS